jgi:LAS superfamily LD-carboxypeptidase LdcB
MPSDGAPPSAELDLRPEPFEFEAEPGEYEAQARPSMPPATTAPAAGRGLEPDQRRWILALDRSAMELLPEAKRRRFAQVDWSRVEFPGNNPKNAAARASWPLADELFSAMAVVIPERRVPQSIRSPQSIRYRDVAREVVPVPGQKSRNPRLYPEARDAFVRMREAAAADGVRLLIDSSWRSRQQQAAVSRNQPNPKAAAGSISAHMYGLAVDLRMSVPGLSADVNTRSPEKMARLVRMYRSPVYKWMALRGREFGWYPYRREPWHWEYNPPGFKERFEGAASRAAGRTEFERSDYEFDYGEAEGTGKWGEEAEVSGPIQAGTRTIDKVPLLQKHQSIGPDLILAWNDMQAAPRAVDVVVHLHGYSLRPGTQLHIERDLKARSGLDWSDPTGRHGTQRRTRPTLALLPRGHFVGGASGRGYSFPALTAEGGLQQLIDFGLNQLAGTLGIPALRCARLIVTAHSGGGAPLLRILSSVDPHEVHVFDGLYQNADALVRWAGRRIARDQSALAGGAVPIERYMSEQGGALRVLHRGGTAHHSLPVAEALRRAIPAGSPLRRWYRVERTAVGHVQIPPVYGWRLLVNAAADVPGASPTVAGPARPAARPTARQVALSSETDFGLRP